MDNSGTTCQCTKRWYQKSEKIYVCTKSDTECPQDFPYFIQEKNQRVKDCYNQEIYNIFYNNECISSCEQNKDKVEIKSNNPLINVARYTCRCKYAWTEGAESKCANNSLANCKDLGDDLLYEVVDTKECVSRCPDLYHFYFNYKCYSKCEDVDSNMNVETKPNTYECGCKGNWRRRH